jgi:hypothetical protein
MLASRPAWRETPVVAALADRARALVDDEAVVALLTPDPELPGGDAEVAAAVRRLMAGVP